MPGGLNIWEILLFLLTGTTNAWIVIIEFILGLFGIDFRFPRN
jgi:hypothetical protein